MAADSQRWKCVEAVPEILFSIKGRAAGARPPAVALHAGQTVAEGVVKQVAERRDGRGRELALEGGASVEFKLPDSFDLSPLVGVRVRVTLRTERVPGGPRAQTLVVSDASATGSDARSRTRLVARFGPAGPVHCIGRWRVRAALSQRPDGPMAFGTHRLQYVLHVGETVRVREGAETLVVAFLARTSFDYVAYVVAERRLWVRGK
jgi:hypothetical protein